MQNYGFATDPLVGSIPPSRLAPCHLPLHKGGFWPGACSDVVLSGEILPISSLKSDNRNTAVPRPPCVKGAVTVGDWGIVSGGELGNLRILQQALIFPSSLGVPSWRETRSAGVSFSAMRKRRKNRQRRGLPPPCGIHPAVLGCQELLPNPGRRASTIPGGKAALLFSVAAGVVRHSLVFGPPCGAPRPTAAGRGRFPQT